MSKLSPFGIPSAGEVIPDPFPNGVAVVGLIHTHPIQPALPPPPEAPNI